MRPALTWACLLVLACITAQAARNPSRLRSMRVSRPQRTAMRGDSLRRLKAGIVDVHSLRSRAALQRVRGLRAKQTPSEEVRSWKTAVTEVMNDTSSYQMAVLWHDLAPTGEEEAGYQDETGAEEALPPVMACMNAEHTPSADMTWEASIAGQMNSLKAVAAWWSTSPQPSLDLTLVSSASMSRLGQLKAQCLSWSGPLSVVLYQPLYQTTKDKITDANLVLLRQAVFHVAQFVTEMAQSHTACQPDVLLTYELFREESARDLLYPQNTLRNLARAQARTPLIAQLDVDLLISRSLHDRMTDSRTAKKLLKKATEGHSVFIIPAVDVRGQLHERTAWADALVTTHKDVAVEAWKQNIVFQFASEGYKQAHNMTNYDKWLQATKDYDVTYQKDAEPWLLSERGGIPWHDERYRGYGLNKQQMVASVHATGYTFTVLHDVFTVHRAHKKSEQRTVLLEGNFRQGVPDVFAKNKVLYGEQRLMHQQLQPFVPPVSTALQNCLKTLSWWQGMVVAPHRAGPIAGVAA